MRRTYLSATIAAAGLYLAACGTSADYECLSDNDCVNGVCIAGECEAADGGNGDSGGDADTPDVPDVGLDAEPDTTPDTTSDVEPDIGPDGGPLCGNGLMDRGEQCDDGRANGGPESTCRSDCTLAICGDGILDHGEECDGEAASNGYTCDSACRWQLVGLCLPCGGDGECLGADDVCLNGVCTTPCGDDFVCNAGRFCDGEFCVEEFGCDCLDVECFEICWDGEDNDFDGLTDCDDGDCFGAEGCEGEYEFECFDGFDNDGDGLKDCQDPDCELQCNGGEVCWDGLDNNENGLVDCEDPQCFDSPDCGVVNFEICGNGADDDLDGLRDCDDPDCFDDPSCVGECPLDEPNNSQDSAVEIPIGQARTGLSCGDDTDYFRLPASRTEVAVILTHHPDAGPLSMWLPSDGGGELIEAIDGDAMVALPGIGQHIFVAPSALPAPPTPYRVAVVPSGMCGLDIFEPNDTAATGYPLDDAFDIEASLCAGDVDVFNIRIHDRGTALYFLSDGLATAGLRFGGEQIWSATENNEWEYYFEVPGLYLLTLQGLPRADGADLEYDYLLSFDREPEGSVP